MILTGPAIRDGIATGDITIEPFDASACNPNSYDYRLGKTVRIYTLPWLDAREVAPTEVIELPDEGMVFEPGNVYLGVTAEIIGSDRYVPTLIGKSSLGRLGVFLQVHADLGHLHAIHPWTLEIVVTQPTRLYPGMVAGQVSFWVPQGPTEQYEGVYGRQFEPVGYLGGTAT